jgi:hypothetical protein
MAAAGAAGPRALHPRDAKTPGMPGVFASARTAAMHAGCDAAMQHDKPRHLLHCW